MAIPLIAPFAKKVGMSMFTNKLLGSKKGKSGSGGKGIPDLGFSMNTFRNNVVDNAPSKSQTNWILIISIIVFVFIGLVVLTYTLIENFEGDTKSKKTKNSINKRYNEYVFGKANVREGFEGFEEREHVKIDNIDNMKQLSYNMKVNNHKIFQNKM
jgi:hypothetical protein